MLLVVALILLITSTCLIAFLKNQINKKGKTEGDIFLCRLKTF